MRIALKIIAALAFYGFGVLTGRLFLSSEQPNQRVLFADQALGRAVLEAGAVELADSDCALPTQPGKPTTVADFLLGYTVALSLGESTLDAECGGRGDGKCSVAYSVNMGEKWDTSILLFARDNDGKLMTNDVTCLGV